ncbi:MAG: 2-oxoacid:acceptor oxidoreductase subunit alpha, partial [Elusimicrobia bacterium]|nr:2-oxoacid:acceptor oxidoreductase subunit alpha [Elusimicrobiota bacterium]
DQHAEGVQDGGGILFNSDRIQVKPERLPPGTHAFGLPIAQLAKNPIMQNTVAMGALMWLAEFPMSQLTEAIQERFGKKKADVVQANLQAAQAGYDYAKAHWAPLGVTLALKEKRRLLMTGNQAIALGALAAGCKFYAAYPMTPASSILHWLATNGPSHGMVVKQAEDEIAAINMAVGAGHVGVRAMTGTSGGGFALMSEAVGLAAMTETPVVIVSSQRGGPSTGLPTKTEQADLFQLLGASQGDFPKIILAPCNIEDAFLTTAEAFNLAEKYQCPVLIASDLLLSEHQETVDGLDLNVRIDRGALITEWNGNGYKRYQWTETGISPRAAPGTEGTVYVAASDEHDENGVVISDVFTNPPVRAKMMEKRMRKLEVARQELAQLWPPQLEGPRDAEVTLVGWGSTQGIVREMLRRLAAEGVRANALMIKVLWPFLSEPVGNILNKARRIIVVENNYTGQLARLIRMETGIAAHDKLLKYDGEPFFPGETFAALKALIAQAPRHVEMVPDVGGRVSSVGPSTPLRTGGKV